MLQSNPKGVIGVSVDCALGESREESSMIMTTQPRRVFFGFSTAAAVATSVQEDSIWHAASLMNNPLSGRIRGYSFS